MPIPNLLFPLSQKKLGLAVRSELESKNPTPPMKPPVAEAPPAPTVQVTIWFDALRHSPLPDPADIPVMATDEPKLEMPETFKLFKLV